MVSYYLEVVHEASRLVLRHAQLLTQRLGPNPIHQPVHNLKQYSTQDSGKK